jgi:hypothetical protein
VVSLDSLLSSRRTPRTGERAPDIVPLLLLLQVVDSARTTEKHRRTQHRSLSRPCIKLFCLSASV